VNWVDITYTRNEIKKDVEGGTLVPKFSNLLSSFDIEKEITIPPRSATIPDFSEKWNLGEGAFITFVMYKDSNDSSVEYKSGLILVNSEMPRNTVIPEVVITSKPYDIRVEKRSTSGEWFLRASQLSTGNSENIVIRLFVKKIC
jgi:hypothetical protein